MVNFTLDQVREIMKDPNNIRNISVIAHVDHGKSTLTDSLIKRAGISSSDRYMDIGKEEKERGITIKSTGVSLYYEYDVKFQNQEQKYLINLIDSPGHVDFSSEVTAALRVTDGALVVVDYVEGVCVQTETVLRQALMEFIKPVVFVNKVDRAFFEQKHDPETMYQQFQRVIENVNVLISTYENSDLMGGSLVVDPLNGSVGFGSAKQGWGFTLHTFARLYAKKFNYQVDRMLEKLWGDNFYNKKTGAWQKESTPSEGDEALSRGFCDYILKPIQSLSMAILQGKKEVYEPILTKFKIDVKFEDSFKEKPTKFLELVLSQWINASDSLLEMIIIHLPSPKIAQRYRTQYLYEGNQDDLCAKAMIDCDPNGPIMMYVSKMIPILDTGKFYAFGRLFSGTISTGKKVSKKSAFKMYRQDVSVTISIDTNFSTNFLRERLYHRNLYAQMLY